MTKSPGEQLVGVRPRTVVMVVGIVLAVVVGLWILWLTRGVLVWLLVALFLAIALNPAVDWLMAHGVRRRGAAVGLVVLAAVAGVVAVAATFVPQVVNDVNDFARAVPGYIDDLTTGRGRARRARAALRLDQHDPGGSRLGRRQPTARLLGTGHRDRAERAERDRRDRRDRVHHHLHAARGA